jgi:hypothetical protein
MKIVAFDEIYNFVFKKQKVIDLIESYNFHIKFSPSVFIKKSYDFLKQTEPCRHTRCYSNTVHKRQWYSFAKKNRRCTYF